jgi:hypothetical protein
MHDRRADRLHRRREPRQQAEAEHDREGEERVLDDGLAGVHASTVGSEYARVGDDV